MFQVVFARQFFVGSDSFPVDSFVVSVASSHPVVAQAASYAVVVVAAAAVAAWAAVFDCNHQSTYSLRGVLVGFAVEGLD